jgi:hypothetical protein
MNEILRVDVGFASGANIIVWGRKPGELSLVTAHIQATYLYEDRVMRIRSEWREESEITDIFPKEIEFNVNERDIKGGVCGNPTNCAIALGLQRNYPEFICSATPDYIRIRTSRSGDEGQKYQTNEVTKNFVHDFDAGKKVYPFTTRLQRQPSWF